MPPKPALTKAERLKNELQAQQARAEALKHLQATGSGPSQSELARQQAERQKLKNATSTRVERFVTGGAGAAAAPTTADKYDPRVRDNTLHAVALRRANEIHQTQRTTQQLMPDPASGDVYYWNERTNETSWDRPSRRAKTTPSSASTAQAAVPASDSEALPSGWEAVTDPASGDVYYWHRTTNETSWTRPASVTVSLQDAIAAKSRLDGILKTCGPSSGAPATGAKRSLSQTPTSAAQSEYVALAATRAQRRAACAPVHSMMPVTSSSSSGKQKKVERKAKEQLAQTLQSLSDSIGKLEDRDTQHAAFHSLLQRLPQLSPSLATECYSLVEKNKRTSRCSTRRMLVLVMAALCKCHPLPSSKLLARIVAYIRTRLRDNEAAVTDACTILVSSITLHVLPLLGPLAEASESATDSTTRAGGDSSAWRTVFESVAAPLLKDANAIGESATNTMYVSFSATFLLLRAACEVARDAQERAGVSTLVAEIVPLVGSIVEAIEDVFQYAPRDGWVLRKRGIELLTSLIEGFGLRRDAIAAPAVEYFQTHLDRVRDLVVSGRQDPVSSVREAASAAAAAFAALDKRFGGHSPVRSGAPLPVSSATLSDLARSATPTHHVRSRHQPKPQGWLDAAADTMELKRPEHEHRDDSDRLDAKAGDDQDEPDFSDVAMDEAAAPESLVDPCDNEEDVRGQRREPVQREQPVEPPQRMRKASSSSLKQFVASQRKQQRIARAPSSDALHLEHENATTPSDDAFDAEMNNTGGDMAESPPDMPATEALGPQDECNNSADADPSAIKYERDGDGDQEDELASMSCADAALRAAECDEFDLALRLCLLEDDVALLKQVLGVIGAPCMRALSRASRTALCAAFLEVLDAADAAEAQDQWLVLAWIRDLALHRASVQQVDVRVLRALEARLVELSAEPSRAGREAARVVAQLGL